MNIFLDANVLVATLNREYPLYTWSARILSLQGKYNITICTSPLCIAIAFYLASKKSGEGVAKRKIDLLCRNIHITSIEKGLFDKCLPKDYYFTDNGLLNLFLSDGNTSLLENMVAIKSVT
jgi:hypothetical protein